MATQRERLGFIGLGSMGRPMATSVVRKGFDVAAFDTDAAHIAVLVERGATRASNLAALIPAADVVITMLPNTPTSPASSAAREGSWKSAAPG